MSSPGISSTRRANACPASSSGGRKAIPMSPGPGRRARLILGIFLKPNVFADGAVLHPGQGLTALSPGARISRFRTSLQQLQLPGRGSRFRRRRELAAIQRLGATRAPPKPSLAAATGTGGQHVGIGPGAGLAYAEAAVIGIAPPRVSRTRARMRAARSGKCAWPIPRTTAGSRAAAAAAHSRPASRPPQLRARCAPARRRSARGSSAPPARRPAPPPGPAPGSPAAAATASPRAAPSAAPARHPAS